MSYSRASRIPATSAVKTATIDTNRHVTNVRESGTHPRTDKSTDISTTAAICSDPSSAIRIGIGTLSSTSGTAANAAVEMSNTRCVALRASDQRVRAASTTSGSESGATTSIHMPGSELEKTNRLIPSLTSPISPIATANVSTQTLSHPSRARPRFARTTAREVANSQIRTEKAFGSDASELKSRRRCHSRKGDAMANATLSKKIAARSARSHSMRVERLVSACSWRNELNASCTWSGYRDTPSMSHASTPIRQVF